jgi:hypothetical protein
MFAAGETKPTTEKAVSEIPTSWFPVVDGLGTKGEFIDLSGKDGGRLYIRYSPIADKGVEIDRVAADGHLVWRAQVQPLGVVHSKYNHKVWVYLGGVYPPLEKGKIRIESVGTKTITEVIDLENGKQLSRKITANP